MIFMLKCQDIEKHKKVTIFLEDLLANHAVMPHPPRQRSSSSPTTTNLPLSSLPPSPPPMSATTSSSITGWPTSMAQPMCRCVLQRDPDVLPSSPNETTRAMGTSTYTIVGCLLHRHNLSKACGSRRGAWQGQVSVYGGAVGRNRRGDEAGNHTRKCPSRCGWSLPPLQSSFMMGLIYLGCGERNWVQWWKFKA